MSRRAQLEDNMIVLDPEWMDEAMIGTTPAGQVVYDYDLLVMVLRQHDGMTWEEAVDYVNYNTVRSLAYLDPELRPVIVQVFQDW